MNSSPSLTYNGLVLIGDNSGTLYAVTAATGALAWYFNASSAIWTAPAVDANNIVYVGATDSYM